MPIPPIPVAQRRAVTQVHFDDARVDDYAWLRDRDDPTTMAYLEAENAHAEAVLAATSALQGAIYDEIVSRIVETDATAAVRWGPWWYYERTIEGHSYPIHCRRPAGDEAYPASLDAPGEQVILDENALALGHEFCSVGILSISPDHHLAAIGVDFEGSERHTVTFSSLDGAEAPPESLTEVSYSVAWTSDARSLFYVRLDDAWRPYELWRHDLGTDQRDDELVLHEPDERFRMGVSRSRDGEAIVVHVSSSTTTEVHSAPGDGRGDLEVVWPRRHGVECAIEHLVAPSGEAWWVAVTNDAAVDFKVVASRASAQVSFNEVLAERPGSRVEAVDAFAGHLVVSERGGVGSAVRLVTLREGSDPFGDDMFARSTTVASDESPATTQLGANPDYEVTSLRVEQTTLVSPLTSIDVDLQTGARTVRKRQAVKGGYDPSRFASSLLWIDVRDGERVPVSVVHRRDLLAPDGAPGDPPRSPAPLLLYGYGAYEICIDPVFSVSRLSVLDRGAIFAIAHVRGGGELGRRWYEAGRLEHKQTSFLDFVDVAAALCDLGFTDANHLVAHGGSAGGLLMGASMNLAPRAFRAVVAEVPFVDVLNDMLDPTLPLTAVEWDEWGDPLHDPEAYRRMKSWSPYDNVVGTELDGSARRYPELLALGSLNDTRVGFWEPAKWVARLRAANPDNAIVFKTDLGAGHGGKSGRYDAWRERALVYAFILDRLGLSAPDAQSPGPDGPGDSGAAPPS